MGLNKEDSVQPELFCCLYKDEHGYYSTFSPYLVLEHQKGLSVLLFFLAYYSHFIVLKRAVAVAQHFIKSEIKDFRVDLFNLHPVMILHVV